VPARIIRPLSLVLLALLAACAPRQNPITFTTTGGDAWTFDKLVEARVAPQACEVVTFASEAGTISARPEGERVFARVPLRPGDSRIDAACINNGVRSGQSASQHWRVRLNDVPKAHARLRLDGTELVIDAGASEPAPAQPSPLITYEWSSRPTNPAELPGLPATGRQVRLMAPHTDGDYFISLRVTDGIGRNDESTAMLRVSNGHPEVVNLAYEHAAWIDRAIVYGIVPRLFGPRGFADVTARLDSLAALGVNTLWLSPITDAPADDFGYAVTDHFRVRPSFGTDDALRDLVQAAHARGLRVILPTSISSSALRQAMPKTISSGATSRT
jgi:cyclomaltodextrinase / maltogenic alpha-amylase / neopullulanase